VISQKRFVKKLRELNYEFKEQLHYQLRYRLKGGTHIIHIPRKDLLDEEILRSTLRQAKQSKEEIEKFIGEAKT
jgi:hypothetical protein